MSLNCSLCNNLFKNKYTLIRHLEKIHLNQNKKTSILIEEIKKNKVKPYQCIGCYCFFSSAGNLTKHTKTCCKFKINHIKNQIDEIDDPNDIKEILDFIKSKKNLPKNDSMFNYQNITMSDNISCQFNIIGKSNVQNNINNNIVMVNLGQESRESIANDLFLSELINNDVDLGNPDQVSEILTKMFKQTHLNSEYPENHNLYI